MDKPGKSNVSVVAKNDYLTLASILEGKEGVQRIHKTGPPGKALRNAAQLYENREYVAAYECLKPIHDKFVSDMQRILARNLDLEANRLATDKRMPLAAAKENIQKMRENAQQVVDLFTRLLQDLENKPIVRLRTKTVRTAGAAAPPSDEAPPTTVSSANETRLETKSVSPLQLVIGDCRYRRAAYSPPEKGFLYAVRDKTGIDRIIRIAAVSPDGDVVQVDTLKHGKPSKKPIQLAVDSLSRQAAKGWCSLLLPIDKNDDRPPAKQPTVAVTPDNVTLRLDSQNFGRCCADIARANIKFTTQLIKDVGDGPFRAGNYEQAFLTFEQIAVGFNAAVASSRRAIADGRRALTAEKGNLSGKEIQERTAAFVRSEQLIHTAEREFSTILEGLRMYLRSQQS
jgi:hypothetical protein